jgi:DNA-binding transcriptional regulator YdaS (Cro superfamily)
MHFGMWWREHRKDWPAEKLAAELGVTRMTLHRWIARKCVPHDATIAAIVRITNGAVTAEDFFPQAQLAAELQRIEKGDHQ